MADTVAHKAKEDGAVAWSKGEYQKAIDHFSKAISHGGDKEFLRTLYSNRSAAYLKVSKPELALEDANKCIEIDANWAKGYTRKGDALHQLKRYSDSYNAYNSGLRASPNDLVLQEKLEVAMRAIRNEANRSSSSATSGAPVTGIIRQVKAAILILIVVYFIPFLPRNITSITYKLAAAAFACLNVYDIYKKYGVPRFSSDYGMLIIPDPSTMKVFLGSLLGLAMKPYLFAIAPVFISEGISFLPEVFASVRDNQSMIESRILPLITRFVPSMTSLPIGQIFNNNNIPVMQQQLQMMSATSEIYMGLYLVVELFLPSRNILTMYLWWQYLRMKVMLDQSGQFKKVFGELDNKINSLLAYQMVPGFVRQGYGMIRSYMIKQAEMPTAPAPGSESQGSGSFLSKCTVM